MDSLIVPQPGWFVEYIKGLSCREPDLLRFSCLNGRSRQRHSEQKGPNRGFYHQLQVHRDCASCCAGMETFYLNVRFAVCADVQQCVSGISHQSTRDSTDTFSTRMTESGSSSLRSAEASAMSHPSLPRRSCMGSFTPTASEGWNHDPIDE